MIHEAKIGILFPLTGEKANSGSVTVKAFPVAYDVAKERGVADDIEIEFVYGDCRDPEAGAAEAHRLIDEGCDIIMGSLISSHSLAITEVTDARGVFYWEVVAAAEEITRRGFSHVFRQSSAAHQYGEHFVKFLEGTLLPGWGLGAGELRLGMVSEDTKFGRSVVDSVTREAARLGLPVVGSTFHSVGAESVADEVGAVAAENPDLVFSASLGPVVQRIWSELLANDVAMKALVGTGSWGLPRYRDGMEGKRDGLYCLDSPHLATLTPENLSPGARETFAMWMERSPEKHSIESIVDPDLAFMAVTTLIEEVFPRADDLSPAALRAASLAIDVPTGGTILGYGTKFAGNGDNERSFRTVVQWQEGGALHTVYPDFLATAEPDLGYLTG